MKPACRAPWPKPRKRKVQAAQRMIRRETDLTGTIITADALNCRQETARDIIERGGEFILQVKDNQKTVHRQAELKTKDLSLFLPEPEKRMDGSTDAT